MPAPTGGAERVQCACGRLALVTMLSLLAASCDDPQQPAPGGDDFRGRYDRLAGTLVFQLTSASGGSTPLQLVATDLVYEATSEQLRAWVAVRNSGGLVLAGPEHIAVYGFVPAAVAPLNAACGSGPNDDGTCWFDHRGTYGDDGLLLPGETSTPVQWILHDPDAASFAFRARLAPVDPEGVVSGLVFLDQDADGRRDVGEPGVAGATLALRRGDTTWTAASGLDGRYEFAVAEAGLYELGLEPRPGWTPTTASPLQVIVVRRPDGSLSRFEHGDFGCVTSGGGTIAVGGVVYEDLNWNARRDLGEPGIPWVELSATACGAEIEALLCDGLGRYAAALPACGGPWSVRAPSLDGYTRTSPKTVTFTVPPPHGEALAADFGYARRDPASRFEVRGEVFRDDNRNGVRDFDEPGIPGVRVTASGDGCASPSAAVDWSDDRGRFELDGEDVHCPLPWLVQCGALPGTDATTPAVLRFELPPADGETYRVAFGVVPHDPPPPPLSDWAIEGCVFLDVDRNGSREAGEPTLPGARLELLGPCRVVRATTTGADGRYRFEPQVVAACAVTAVRQSVPDFDDRTTPNPMPIDPEAAPLGGVLQVDFGVEPQD